MPQKITVTTDDIRDYLVGEFGLHVKTPELQLSLIHI